MSSVSKSAGAVPVHKSKAKAAQTRRGLLYALPDWLMIIVLFFVPIVLLVVMACSRWSLLGGNRGVNFPDNFVKVFENKLFWPSIWFTLEYTVIVTVEPRDTFVPPGCDCWDTRPKTGVPRS